MKKIFAIAAVLAALVSCERPLHPGEEEWVPIITDPMIEAPTVHFNLLTISASSEGPDTKTTLSGQCVLWDQNDQIRVVGQGQQETLTVNVNGKSQGIGVKVSGNSTKAYIKYDYIKVVLNEKDITSEITTGTANSYRLGTYSRAEYVYAKAGEVIEVDVNASNNVIPLVQSSSTSTISLDNVAVVTLRGVQYSLDQKEWISVGSSTSLSNGKSWGKSDVSYSWGGSGVNLCMTLSSEPGLTRGEFAGLVDSSSTIDESVVAVYPNSAYKSYVDSEITLDIPGTQTYVENSFDHTANVMVGSLSQGESGYDVSFKNMMGVLELSLSGDNIYLSSITVTDKAGMPLWGTAAIPAEDFASGISTSRLTGGSSSVTLDCTGVILMGEPTVFDIVVPVDAFSAGLQIKVETDDRSYQTLSSSSSKNTILRSDIKQMPSASITKLVPGTINVENAALQKYMSYDKYASFGSTSYFGTYSSVLNASLCVDQDRPEILTINWLGDASSSYTVSLTDKTVERVVFDGRTVAGTSYEFENMVPGHTYSYEIKSGESTVRKGEFKTEGQVRMVNIADSWNWRDLGGWKSTLGGSVKYEWLYRGGSLNGEWNKSVSASTNTVGVATNYVFSQKATQQVLDLGIKAELDLRGKTGDGQAWSQESGIHSRSIEVTHLPIESGDFAQIMTDQGLQNPLSISSVVTDVEWIIDQVMTEHHPVAFHCKSGADRTGAVGMILLALLGVDPGDIARDYELTTLSHEKLILDGQSSFQTRRADQTSYKFFKEGFTTKDSFKEGKTTYTLSTTQEKAYYYLNRYFVSGDKTITKGNECYIRASKLDSFIKFMLGIDLYSHPEWAKE